ncbi:replication endonuclease [Psychromonas aquimarina]|uniref:replication endonuclease n=1 Tax=Psychromonas aquimarina TaxID=444919 RepID=UPI0003F9404A|nr:replication endonuclease [Psychromonas aquimarina]
MYKLAFQELPEKTLENAHCGTQSQWSICEKHAVEKLNACLPVELAASVYKQYVQKWDYHMSKSGTARSANIWFRKVVETVERSVKSFPVDLRLLASETGREMQAVFHAEACLQTMVDMKGSGLSHKIRVEATQAIADEWGFVVHLPGLHLEQEVNESDEEFELRKVEVKAEYHVRRLIDVKWWKKKIENAYRQFCEHCQIVRGYVRKGVSNYVSQQALRDAHARHVANMDMLESMLIRNDVTGEEHEMLDIYKGSISNPELRRHDLMVRMRGFENWAQQNNLIGGFFTITAPSQYHPCRTKANGKVSDNPKYKGASPRETQDYLNSVWKRVRTKLGNHGIQLAGFRVCEPHHDAAPHWHALFFFKPEQEQFIRFVISDYFTQADREELNANNDEFDAWNKLVVRKASKEYWFPELSEFDEKLLITPLTERIEKRVKYVRIDEKFGSATAYIAKYIAKNVDGYQVENNEDGEPANKLAFAACAWSKLHRIRQFQQIGGPPVTVYRESRRLEQDPVVKAAKEQAKEAGEKYTPEIKDFFTLKREKDPVELVRFAADAGNWSMFIDAMGGLHCKRSDRPVQIAYCPKVNDNGEAVKVLKGLSCRSLTMITHDGNWSIVKKGSAAPLEKNDSFSLGVLSITVRERLADPDILGLWSEFKQKGEPVSVPDFERFLLGSTLVIETTVKGDIKRQRKAKLKQSYLDRGSYSVDIWEDVRDMSCLYIENLINTPANARKLKSNELAPVHSRKSRKDRIYDMVKLDEALAERGDKLKLCYRDSGWRTSYSALHNYGSDFNCAPSADYEALSSIEVNTASRLAMVKAWAEKHGVELIETKAEVKGDERW